MVAGKTFEHLTGEDDGEDDGAPDIVELICAAAKKVDQLRLFLLESDD